IIGFEGSTDLVEAQVASARRTLARTDAMDAGRQPGENWLANRYQMAFRQSEVFGSGAFSDTMEVSTTWDRVERLYARVREATSPHAFVMAHFSHAYRTGCGVYFTFVGYRQGAGRTEVLYDRVWSAAMEAVQEVGATISHHHGVGLLKRESMPYQHGAMANVWHVLKESMDPRGIMNPGKLFPDRERGTT
ncbi:MAG: FAD-linked oxidase C-terminal domain-containing protein, partial [Myxococcota bacterium]|nr:FAD-linked oxidase C-terminal domain-containing protein [Myxococcota bacterium]